MKYHQNTDQLRSNRKFIADHRTKTFKTKVGVLVIWFVSAGSTYLTIFIFTASWKIRKKTGKESKQIWNS